MTYLLSHKCESQLYQEEERRCGDGKKIISPGGRLPCKVKRFVYQLKKIYISFSQYVLPPLMYK